MNGQGTPPRILLVDDDADLVGVLSRGLDALGFDVTAATSAGEALQIDPDAQPPFDVLVTDMELIDGWGATLAFQLQQRRPGLKVVFMSGYVDKDPLIRHGIQDHMAFLEKPFTVQRLAQVLNEVLGRAT